MELHSLAQLTAQSASEYVTKWLAARNGIEQRLWRGAEQEFSSAHLRVAPKRERGGAEWGREWNQAVIQRKIETNAFTHSSIARIRLHSQPSSGREKLQNLQPAKHV